MTGAPLDVGLVQINEGMTWTRQRWARCRIVKGAIVAQEGEPDAAAPEAKDYSIFPYSVGLLQAYHDQERPGLARFRPPLYRRISVPQAVEQLAGVDVAAFSAYVWNVNLSLAIAAALRDRDPGVLIVFGGPQVPDRPEEFLRAHPFIDVACCGEGERVFSAVLDRARSRDFSDVPGIGYVGEGGVFRQNPRLPRIEDLSAVPSPYLSGAFDPLMAAHPQERWILLWETNRGCPFSCSFCDWGSAVASKVFRFETERLYAELEWFGERRGEFIFCCDANFGILPRDLDLARHAVEVKRRLGYPHALSVQNSKNASDRTYEIQKLLSDAGMNSAITLSMQSLNPPTLENIRRKNISLDHFERLQTSYTRDGAETYTDIILGLPGETYDSFADGIDRVVEGGQHNRILFYNLSILPNAEMGDPAYQQLHGLVSVEQRILNAHSSVDQGSDVPECLRTVVGTRTMPPRDWVRAKALWWTADLVYFGRLLQIPAVLTRHVAGVRYRAILEALLQAGPEHPVIHAIVRMFSGHAESIQQGGDEYLRDTGRLGVYWPADQFALVSLVTEGKLDAFYGEAESLLQGLFEGSPGEHDAVHEAFLLNRQLMRVPGPVGDSELRLRHNVWDVYQGVLNGQPAGLEERPTTHRIDRAGVAWDDLETWCEHVIWCTNRKGAYLHLQRVVAEAAPVPS